MVKAYAAMAQGGALEAYEFDAGSLNADEVEIHVESCGICHSDLSMIDNEWGLSQYPLVAGHEIIGTVQAVGKDVESLAVGQKVGLGWQAGFCNHCHQCHTGDHNLCAESIPTIMNKGGFAETVRASADAVIPLPAGLDARSAGPLLCGGITVFNPLVQFDIKPTDKVGVIGIGGLGHLAIQFLNAWGCEVTAFTSSEAKKAEALEMGAHHTLDSTKAEDLAAAANRFDYLLSTVNIPLDWNAYVGTLSPKGRLHFVGATLEPLDLNVFPLLMAQRSVSASPVGSPETIKQMLDFAVQHDIKPMVEYFPLSEVNDALDHLRSGKARYRVVLENN